MQSIYEAANEQSSAETLFSIENTPENTAYFLLDYKNIDTLEPLGKLIMEIDVDTFPSLQSQIHVQILHTCTQAIVYHGIIRDVLCQFHSVGNRCSHLADVEIYISLGL